MPENDNDMQRMQQDAIRRVREMQSRARNLQQAPSSQADQHGGTARPARALAAAANRTVPRIRMSLPMASAAGRKQAASSTASRRAPRKMNPRRRQRRSRRRLRSPPRGKRLPPRWRAAA